MNYLGYHYETATATYTLRDGRPCKQQVFRIENGDWHTRYLSLPFSIDCARDDCQDHNAEHHIREIKSLTFQEVGNE